MNSLLVIYESYLIEFISVKLNLNGIKCSFLSAFFSFPNFQPDEAFSTLSYFFFYECTIIGVYLVKNNYGSFFFPLD